MTGDLDFSVSSDESNYFNKPQQSSMGMWIKLAVFMLLLALVMAQINLPGANQISLPVAA